jgi:predicted lipoprotein with Yx(FWY)xxD motif
MKRLFSTWLLVLGVVGATALLSAAAQAHTTSRSRLSAPTGPLVALRKTALGSVLVDTRGRTLYLFEKDRNGVSACNTACLKYWPALTSSGMPRAGSGVHQSLLRVTAPRNGRSQVIYAGHPLYTFVGDKRPGQTTGEDLTNFGGGWYALAASGRKIERAQSSSGNGSGSGYGGGGGYGSGGGGYGYSSGRGW